MVIASLVAHETKGGDESSDPILASYNFEDKEDPAEHPKPFDPLPVPTPDPPPKKKRH